MGLTAGVSVQERENVRLVITDTPGPNNSNDPKHALTTMRYISDTDRHPLVLYVLNSAQFATNDDKRLLQSIAEIMQEGGKQSKDRFIFVLNKVDKLAAEGEENVKDMVEEAKTYLKGNGIENPLVYPVSALLTLLLRQRKLNPDLLTEDDLDELHHLEKKFKRTDKRDLVQYMPLTTPVKNKLEAQELPNALYRSGLPAVELVIDNYIEKYSLPDRVARANKALEKLIENSKVKAKLLKDLEMDEQELKELKESIMILKKKENQSFETDGYIEKLKQQQKGLSQDAIQAFMEQEGKIRTLLSDFGNSFTGKGTKHEAERMLQDLSDDLEHQYNRMTINLEKNIEASQEEIKQELKADYQAYVSSLFEDVKDLKLPVMQGLKEQVSTFSFSIEEVEVKKNSKKVKTGTKTESNSTWYKPWTWLNKREVATYDTITEEYVNYKDLWENRKGKIGDSFKDLTNNARNQAEVNANSLLGLYIEFMTDEFEKRFEKLLTEIDNTIQNKENTEQSIAKGTQDLQHIESFNNSVANVLSLSLKIS